MSEHLYDEGAFLPHGGLVWIANPVTMPQRILTSDEWHRIGHIIAAPRQELIWRLNQRIKGEEPGSPINWKGLP